MEVTDIFTDKEIELIVEAGIKVEKNKKYSKAEIKKWAIDIQEYTISHTSKGKTIQKLNNLYDDIYSKINRL